MSEPDLRWALPEKKRSRRRAAVIVALVIAALLIAGIVLLLLIPRGGTAPEPSASPSSTTSTDPTPSPTPSASTADPTPTVAPTETLAPPSPPQPGPDEDVVAFGRQMQPWLSSASQGLGFIPDSDSAQSVAIVDQLLLDSQRLAEASAPASIQEEWSSRVFSYADSLEGLRSAAQAEGDVSGALSTAQARLQSLQELVGA